jgi:hypothetical protein
MESCSMAGRGDPLSDNFSRMIRGIENETKLLKSFLHLRNLSLQNSSPHSLELQQKLRQLDGDVENIEANLSDFEQFLDSELVMIEQLEEMNHLVQEQCQTIAQIEKNLPAFFKESSPSQVNNSSAPFDFLIELHQFETVPKSTRSRLTLEQTIAALGVVHRLILEKEEVHDLMATSTRTHLLVISSEIQFTSQGQVQCTDHCH